MDSAGMGRVDRLGELAELIRLGGPLYLRYSLGPESDAVHPSGDHEPIAGVSGQPIREAHERYHSRLAAGKQCHQS